MDERQRNKERNQVVITETYLEIELFALINWHF